MSASQANVVTLLQPLDRVPDRKPDLATSWIIGFALASLLTHILAVVITPYEVHRDEFLYWAMGKHLRTWYMDFPPAIAFLARAASFLFGNNLFALRFFPALAGAAIIALGAMLAREFGGGRAAQVITMLALFFGPLFARPAALFHPVVWDQLWWTVGFFAVARLVREDHPRWWRWLGVAGGLGLLTKFSILFFAFGLFVAVLLSAHRRWLAGRGLWSAALIAIVTGSPTWVGQIRLHFPVIIHMSDLRSQQLATHVTVSSFVLGQVWMLGPALLLAVLGLVYLFRTAPFRPLAVTCVIVFLLLLALHGKPYYLGPVYPCLLAAGAAALDQFQPAPRRVIRWATIGILLLTGLIAVPFGLPLLPPALMAKYCAQMGVQAAVTTNQGTVLPLPQDYADMVGWENQVGAVANFVGTLPADERARTGLVARNYGEAGALEFYAQRHGLAGMPIMLPDNFLLWPVNTNCIAVVTIGIPPADLQPFFRSVRVVAEFDHPWMVEEERHRPICVAETPIRDGREGWRERRGL